MDEKEATKLWNDIKIREIDAHNIRVDAKNAYEEADYKLSMIQDKKEKLEKKLESKGFVLVGIAEQRWEKEGKPVLD